MSAEEQADRAPSRPKPRSQAVFSDTPPYRCKELHVSFTPRRNTFYITPLNLPTKRVPFKFRDGLFCLQWNVIKTEEP